MHHRNAIIGAIFVVAACAPGISLFAQSASPQPSAAAAQATVGAAGGTQAAGARQAAPLKITQTPLSLDEALRKALDASSQIHGASAAWYSARAKAMEARLQMLPSVSLSGSYTRLSVLPASVTSIFSSFGISSPSPNAYSFGITVRYPVFSGFRLLEAAKIAALQSTGKQLGIAVVRRAVTFEVERAYWEGVRAGANVETMKKNADLVAVLLQQVRDEVDQGLSTQQDLLSAEERDSQAKILLNDAVSQRNQAFLVLASLLGQESVGKQLAGSGSGGFKVDAPPPYVFTTDPSKVHAPELSGNLDPAKLAAAALANRPEMQTAEVGVQTAQHAAALARGGLYPTLAIVGDYTYANPNQRVLFGSTFVGTWDVGVALSFDVGKLPAAVEGAKAAEGSSAGAAAQAAAERTKILLDVRRSLLSFEQARQDVTLTKSSVAQAQEDLRVMQQKLDNGVATHSDVLESQLALLRAQFAMTNQEVDRQIASDDLVRAAALGSGTK